MTTVEDGTRQFPSFPEDRRVRITDLSSHQDDLSSQHIAAQVVLIWPYSSSTRKFSLLLSETDARPLKGRKQVKVTFLNGAARAAQQSKVGIGDQIRLQLEGCQWAQTDDVISTPGKRIDRDIQFRKSLAFEIIRSSGRPQQVQYKSTGTPSPVASPAVNGVLEIIPHLQIAPSKTAISYSTPAARKVSRLSSTSYFDSPLDPFAEDKEYVYGRSSKRTKFARSSGDWKLIDDEVEVEVLEVGTPVEDGAPESIQKTKQASVEPEQRVAQPETTESGAVAEVIDLISPLDEPSQVAPFPSQQISATRPPPTSVQEAESDTQKAAPSTAAVMKPPETPARSQKRQRPLSIDVDDHAEDSDATSTPRLLPMASPGLPLVSPLIRRSGVGIGYFPPAKDGVSELDAIGKPEEEARPGRRSSTATSSEASGSDDSLVILDEPPEKIQQSIPSSAIGPEVVEDEDMYGASQPPPSTTEPGKASRQRSRDALDVLEEFLQISPTLPEESYHIENKTELQALTGLAATPDYHRGVERAPAMPEPAEDGAASERSIPNESMSDQPVPEPAISEPESDEIEVVLAQARESGLSPVRSQSASSEDADEVEIQQGQVEELETSPVQAQSASSENPEEEEEVLQGQMEEPQSEPEFEPEPSPTPARSANSGVVVEAETVPARVEGSASPVRSQSIKGKNAVEMEIVRGQVEGLESSPIVSQSADSEIVGAVEIVQTHVEEPASPGERQSISSEDEEERRPPSRALSLDGTMDEGDDDSLEQTPLWQNAAHEASTERRQATPEPLADVSQNIRLEVKPAFDEAAQALKDSRNQLPPTPTQTQDRPVASEFLQVLDQDLSLLPTPDNTQEQEQSAPSQVVPAQDLGIEETEETMQPSGDVAEAQQPRRASQRLTRRSVASDAISSPYFTARRPQRALRSSPVRGHSPPPVPSESLPASSPPVEPPSSPTRPVTRSQRDTSRFPFVSVTGDQLGEAEALPSSPTQPVQEPNPQTGASTSGSYYPVLASLKEHFSQLVDVIALAVDDSAKPERAKSGPKDHYTILHLVDPSLDSTSKVRTTAQIFRPARQALPTARRGDVVVLRNFRVQTAKHKWILLSTESSAWAVFSTNPNTRSMFDEVTMSGPPVEYAAGERLQVNKLVQWWQAEGEDAFPAFGKKPSVEIPRRNGESSANTGNATNTDSTTRISFEKDQEVVETIEPPPLSPRRTRRRNNMTDNFGNEDDPLTLAAEERDTTTPTAVRHQPARRAKSKTPAVNGKSASPIALNKSSPPVKRGPTSTKRGPSLVHELRDGTEYVDNGTAAEEMSPPLAPRQTPTRRGPTPSKGGNASTKRGPSLVHELRDGTKYVDDGREHTGGTVHELRDGRNYVDE